MEWIDASKLTVNRKIQAVKDQIVSQMEYSMRNTRYRQSQLSALDGLVRKKVREWLAMDWLIPHAWIHAPQQAVGGLGIRSLVEAYQASTLSGFISAATCPDERLQTAVLSAIEVTRCATDQLSGRGQENPPNESHEAMTKWARERPRFFNRPLPAPTDKVFWTMDRRKPIPRTWATLCMQEELSIWRDPVTERVVMLIEDRAHTNPISVKSILKRQGLTRRILGLRTRNSPEVRQRLGHLIGSASRDSQDSPTIPEPAKPLQRQRHTNSPSGPSRSLAHQIKRGNL
jgi:hypothetical protein